MNTATNTVTKIKLLFVLGLMSQISATALADTDLFDAPQSVTSWTRLEAKPSRKIKSTCSHFGKFAVVEESTSVTKGAVNLWVRLLEKNKTNELCEEKYRGKFFALPVHDQDFIGVKNQLIFIAESDPSAGSQSFEVFHALKGEKVYSAVRDNTQPFLVRAIDEAIEIEFFKGLDVKCALAAEGNICWQKILKDNQIPNSAGVKRPKCQPSFKAAQSPLDNTALVAAPVRIKNLEAPIVQFIKGQSTCHPSP